MSKFVIDVTRDEEPEGTIKTEGYLLLYLKDSEIKFAGSVDLKSMGPIIMKAVMNRMSK